MYFGYNPVYIPSTPVDVEKFTLSRRIRARLNSLDPLNHYGKNCFGTVAYLIGLCELDNRSFTSSEMHECISSMCVPVVGARTESMVVFFRAGLPVHAGIVIGINPVHIYSRMGDNRECKPDGLEAPSLYYCPDRISYFFPKLILRP